jgi:hypothetical protein
MSATAPILQARPMPLRSGTRLDASRLRPVSSGLWTMAFNLRTLCAAGLLMAAASATLTLQQAAAHDAEPECLAPRIAVYFPEGQSAPTREAEDVLLRTAQAASACSTARVGVLASFDPTGPDALTLTLARLAAVAERLQQAGVAADRIELLVRPTDASAGPGRIEVRVDAETGDASPRARRSRADAA